MKVMEFLHVKPGKGSAFVRTKLKNLLTGNVNEKTFRSGEGLTGALVEGEDLQYSYEEDGNYYFMNVEYDPPRPTLRPPSVSGVACGLPSHAVSPLSWNVT